MRARIQGWMMALVLITGPVAAGTPLPDTPHIVVSGDGKVSAKPDSARVQFDFEKRASHPLPAKQAVDASVNRLLASLDDYGIADDEVTASSLNASEDVEYTDDGKRVSNGYSAARSVTVIFKQLDSLNDFLDNGLASGADEIANVQFESTRASDLRTQAKQKAVDNAKLKAVEMAAAFGASLGPVYSIDSINSRYAGTYSSTTLDRIQVTGTRISKGRYIQPLVDYTESVSAVFELRR